MTSEIDRSWEICVIGMFQKLFFSVINKTSRLGAHLKKGESKELLITRRRGLTQNPQTFVSSEIKQTRIHLSLSVRAVKLCRNASTLASCRF